MIIPIIFGLICASIVTIIFVIVGLWRMGTRKKHNELDDEYSSIEGFMKRDEQLRDNK